MSKSQDEPDDEPGDDIPWADPAIRTDYEAALGRFTLAFNEVDYRLSQVITSVRLGSEEWALGPFRLREPSVRCGQR
jgi:hypothetical protein